MIWALEELPNIAVGDVVAGKYEITNLLGSGAMGVVYEALHTRLRRKVALKRLRAEFTSNPKIVERFEREAIAASAIGHPNIVQIFDAGSDASGLPYLAMERLHGQSLGELLRDAGKLEVPQTIEICTQVLAGLGAAHAAGILHRDIKPDNIFVTKDDAGKDVVKILDFGISKILEVAEASTKDAGNITGRGVVLGTPNYMSPEQICTSPDIDMRADLWSVVCVLYKCLSGRTPFVGKTRQELMAATLRGEYLPIRERCPLVPATLDSIVLRGLMPDVEDRYPDALSLRQALEKVPRGGVAATLLLGSKEPRVEALVASPSSAPDTVADSLAQNLASPVPPENPEMLEAFDNLANRFLAQEADELPLDLAASVDGPPAPTRAPASSEHGNLFLPPGSKEEEEVALDLDIAPASGPEPRIHQRLGKAEIEELAPEASKAPARPARAKRPTISQEESGSRGGFVFKSIVLVLVVAAGGALYRYITLGFVLPQASPRRASLELTIMPKDAQVYMDDVLLAERSLAFDVGEPHHLRVVASNRIEMQATIDADPGANYKLTAYLSHPMLKLDAKAVAVPEESEEKVIPLVTIAAARAKLDALGECGPRLTNAATAIVTGPKIDAADMASVDRSLVEECGTSFGLALGMKPAMESLDKSTRVLRQQITAYNQSLVAFQKGQGRLGPSLGN